MSAPIRPLQQPDDYDLRYPPAWTGQALCAQIGASLWFPEKGGSTRIPKAVCRRCPCRMPCLREALDGPELHGVWGGLSPEERETAALDLERGLSLKEIIDAADEAAFEHKKERVA